MNHYGVASTQNSHTNEGIPEIQNMAHSESPTAIILAIAVLTSTIIGSITKFAWVLIIKGEHEKNK